MKPEAQRIAIAEACGPRLFVICKHIHDPFCYYRPEAHGYTNNVAEAWKVTKEEGQKHVGGDGYPDCVTLEPAPIPDYPRDLNAMHEAEKLLTDEQKIVFAGVLRKICGVELNGTPTSFPMIHATAAQKSEAILKTLGKWE